MYKENIQKESNRLLGNMATDRSPGMFKKSAQKNREHFHGQNVDAACEHNKMTRNLPASFSHALILQCLSLVTQVIKKKRGICSQIPRSRARHVLIGLLPAISAATTTTTISPTISTTKPPCARSLWLGLIDGQGSPS